MFNRIMRMNRAKLIFFILLIAFSLRLVWISMLEYEKDQWGEEGCQEAAVSLLEGKGYVMPPYYGPDGPPMYAWRVPMFSFFLAGTYFLFGIHNFLAAAILLAIINVLMCLLVYYIAKMIFNDRVGVISCFICTIYPTFIFWSGFLSPENLTIFLLAFTVFFIVKSVWQYSVMNYIFAGFLWGLTSLSRPQILLFLPFFFIYILFVVVPVKKAIKKIVFILLFLLIPVGVWTVRNYHIYHKIVPMETVVGEVFHIANNDEAFKSPAGFAHIVDPHTAFKGMNEVEVNRWYWREAIKWIKANPGKYLRLVGDRFLRFWRFWPHMGAGITGLEVSQKYLTYSWKHLLVGLFTIAPVILLGLAGIFLSMKYWRKTLLLLLLILQFSFTTILGRVVLRYREPIMPYMIIFASYVLCLIWERINSHAKQR